MGSGGDYEKCYRCLKREYDCQCRPDHKKLMDVYTTHAKSLSISELEDLVNENIDLLMSIQDMSTFRYLVESSELYVYKLTLETVAAAREFERRKLPRETEVKLYHFYDDGPDELVAAQQHRAEAEDTFGIRKAWVEFESDLIVGIRIQPKHRSSETNWRFYYSDILRLDMDADSADCLPLITIDSASVHTFRYYFPEFKGFRIYGVEAGNDYLTVCLVKYGPNTVSPDFC